MAARVSREASRIARIRPPSASQTQEASMSANSQSRPDTIVLIHGLWMTPRSWEKWVERYRSRGFKVLAPAYPGLEVEVEALRRDPSPIERLTIDGVTHHYETVIRALPQPPIIMGHSFG